MRRMLLALAVTILVVASWPAPRALAQDNNRTRGTISAVGADSVTVKVRDAEMRFSVDAKTIVEARGAGTKDRQAEAAGKGGPKLNELVKTGDAVEVTYVDSASGALRATRIRSITSGAAAATTEKPSEMISSGTVKSVAGNTLTITGSSGGGATFTQSFTIDSSTRVLAKGAGTAAAAKGGKLVITDAVGAGDRVSVSFHESGNTLIASEVRVSSKAPVRSKP